MRILLLSRRRWLYSTRRFRETARLRGHEITIADPLECMLLLDPGPRLTVDGQSSDVSSRD